MALASQSVRGFGPVTVIGERPLWSRVDMPKWAEVGLQIQELASYSCESMTSIVR